MAVSFNLANSVIYHAIIDSGTTHVLQYAVLNVLFNLMDNKRHFTENSSFFNRFFLLKKLMDPYSTFFWGQ